MERNYTNLNEKQRIFIEWNESEVKRIEEKNPESDDATYEQVRRFVEWYITTFPNHSLCRYSLIKHFLGKYVSRSLFVLVVYDLGFSLANSPRIGDYGLKMHINYDCSWFLKKVCKEYTTNELNDFGEQLKKYCLTGIKDFAE